MSQLKANGQVGTDAGAGQIKDVELEGFVRNCERGPRTAQAKFEVAFIPNLLALQLSSEPLFEFSLIQPSSPAGDPHPFSAQPVCGNYLGGGFLADLDDLDSSQD